MGRLVLFSVFYFTGFLILALLLSEGGINFFVFFILTFLLTSLCLWWYTRIIRKKRVEERIKLLKFLDTLPDFHPDEKFVTSYSLIALDKTRKKIALKEKDGNIFIIPLSVLQSCEVIIDNRFKYHSPQGMLRMAAGQIIAGLPGAILGGLSAKLVEVNEIQSFELLLLFNSKETPEFHILFFDAFKESNNLQKRVKTNDKRFTDIIHNTAYQIDKWKLLLDDILKEDLCVEAK